VKRKLLVLCALTLAASTVHAGSGGSIYSLLGIGDLRMMPNVRAAGMGYTGYAITSPYYINTLSPATWTQLERVRMEASLLYEGFHSSNGTQSRYLARADFGGAMLALPVSPRDGIVVGMGFIPYSKVDFDTYTTGEYTGVEDTLAYSINHKGLGGISKGQIGISWAPTRNFSVGGSLNYLFGTLEARTTMVPRNTVYSPGTQNEETTMNGVNFTMSAMADNLGSFLPALSPFTLGFAFTTGANLTTTHRYTYIFVGRYDTTSEQTGSLKIPVTVGVGVTYHPSERWLLAADFTTQPWSTSEFRGGAPAALRDAQSIGIGIERLPSREPGASLPNRTALRLGFLYQATYYNPNGEPINAWAATAGVGIPVSMETYLNLAVEYGTRGTLNQGLILDKIFRFSASLTISERWFVRPEED